ncbi:efflux RND transporter permease subunit [Leptospira santarosai]|uniref:RND transporter, Hydrophobe/Amphiphile Efflux-1 (HAE1)/Heavy Metal Efflux (HME) family, permease protein n=2 Tax=Leptospira santarosai TaxID=28183 RepID=M6UZB1_9LEPT|nr:efflux RND transporter permease subunit [Leptospira santarosai]EKS06640.1 RND transporter, Hydrophobe/Amphiphile Efflux-1 (HAE1)/Heavy Metal Efflux (HME) family, permease protein [Leptospira santarosai str. JET]EKT86650.1 multidrug transporter [Leptospira santarosai serovar Shermani str. LT 821]EMJ48424.1 RND transporter, hydrophobe/amphiphile efflux-1/heavy metal efflux family, permease protein [Leptospira santarosai str. HAI1349]EMO46359.1 RND transporter, Hydrophobe/Amphiphile Efflux-1 (H
MAKNKKKNDLREYKTVPEPDREPSVLTLWVEKHKTGTAMIFLSLILLGIISFRFIPISLFPEAPYPGLTVETEYFGVGPEKIEEIITKPIEESVSTLGGIEHLFSVSEEGKSKVHIQFDQNADLEIKSLEIRDKVEQVSYKFPRETQKPVVLQYDPTQKPSFIIVPKSASLNIMEIREISDREIKKIIEGIPGVSEVVVAGGKPREILVSCDSQKMLGYGVDMNLLLSALQEGNYNENPGEVTEGNVQIPVYVKGRMRSLKEIESLSLRKDNSGKLVRVEDVAKVSFSYREEHSAARVNGENTVSIYVYRAGTANLLAVSDELKQELKKAENENLNFEMLYDQAETVTTAIRNFFFASSLGFLLFVIAASLIFQEFKSSWLFAFFLVCQFFIGSILMYFLKIDYNLVTIVGLILGCGCCLCVFISNRLFSDPEKNEKSIAITGEIFTTILLVSGVFLPILFATKELKSVYGGLGFVLSGNFFVSFLISITILPSFRGESGFKIGNFSVPKVLKTLISKADPLSFYVHRMKDDFIRRTLSLVFYAKENPRIFLSFYILFILIGIYFYLISKHEFINKVEEKQLIGNVEFPSGTSFARINNTTERIEKNLSELYNIKEVNSRVENGKSTIVVKFNESVSDVDEIGKELEEIVGDIKPAFIYFSGSNDEALLKEVTIDVIGDDLNTIDRITREVSSTAQGLLPNVRHVLLRYKPPREEVRVAIDKEKSESLGISSQDIGRLVRYGIQGGVATKFIEEDREVDVRIRYDSNFRDQFSDLKDYKISTEDGKSVPLLEVASLTRGTTPVRIYRKNKRRVLSFSLRIADMSLTEIIPKLEKLKQIELPKQYRIEFGDSLKKVLEHQKKMNFILSFAALILFMILASYLESLKGPFLLLSVLPLPLFLIIIFVYFIDIPLTIPVYIGMIIISAFAILEAFILRKELAPWKDRGEKFESGTMPYDLTEKIKSLSAKFFQLWFLIALFYLPSAFSFGTGSAMLKTVSITLILGLVGICFFTPIVFITLYLYPITIANTVIRTYRHGMDWTNFRIKELRRKIR